MFIQPSPQQLFKAPSPSINTPQSYSGVLKIHEKSIVACILSLAAAIILSSMIFAIAYPSAVFIIILSLAVSLMDSMPSCGFHKYENFFHATCTAELF